MSSPTRIVLALLVTTFIGAAAIPLASANHVSTYCTGGDDDPYATPMTGALTARGATTEVYYFGWNDYSIWKEANGIPGLQRTDRTCMVLDSKHRVVSSYTVYEADVKVPEVSSPSVGIPSVPTCTPGVRVCIW